MMKNIKELCLSIQQVQELQALGLILNNIKTAMVFCDFNDQIHEYELMNNSNIVELGAIDIIPTLSIEEMLEMIPRRITYNQKEYTMAIYPCAIGYLVCYEFYDYDGEREDKIDIHGHSFIDTLFNTFKFLLKEKLI